MSREAYIQLAIFYGGLSAFVIGALLYALRLSRRAKAESGPITSKSDTTESADALELMDRSHNAFSYVQMALGDQVILARHPELMILYREAVSKLESLYRAAGNTGKS